MNSNERIGTTSTINSTVSGTIKAYLWVALICLLIGSLFGLYPGYQWGNSDIEDAEIRHNQGEEISKELKIANKEDSKNLKTANERILELEKQINKKPKVIYKTSKNGDKCFINKEQITRYCDAQVLPDYIIRLSD